MLKELKEKLDNLSEKYAKDIDVIALKALCTLPESEAIINQAKILLEKLEKKYADIEEIENLIPKEEVKLEDLIKILEEKYANDINFIMLKAMMNLEDSAEKEKAMKVYLRKINLEDEDIKKYLASKDNKNSSMVFVKGGFYEQQSYYPLDLYVSKYQVIQEEWEKIMGENPSTFKGERKPVENVTWWKALEYCNKLSEKEGLAPIYKLEDDNFKIIHLDGEEVHPYLADFSKTEGYRLPTQLEWEWFARGGEKGIEDGTFNCEYAGSDNKNEVAWNKDNASNQTHDVGAKKKNALGLYDCSGNVFEWCYDTLRKPKKGSSDVKYFYKNSMYREAFGIDENKYYYYDSTIKDRVLRGGSWLGIQMFYPLGGNSYDDYCKIKDMVGQNSNDIALPKETSEFGIVTSDRWNKKGLIGFRVVRTANPVI